MTKASGLWRAVTIALGGFFVVFAAGYVPTGDGAAGPIYDVIREWGGVRTHAVVMALVGVLLLVSMWTRAALVGMFVAVVFCGWTVIALYLGYRMAGYGWGAWVVFAFAGFVATILAWFPPQYAWSPLRRWLPRD